MVRVPPDGKTSTGQPLGGGGLATFTLRREGMPLHRQIHDLIREEILEDRLTLGTRLPPEVVLAEQWGVSLAPVRRALVDLAAEGYLERNQGRGTFVRPTKIDEKLAVLSSFSGRHKEDEVRPQLTTLSFNFVPATHDLASALGALERRVVLLRRVAHLDSSPVALLSAYLDPTRFPGIEGMELEQGSLYRTLEAFYDVDLARASTVIEAIQVADDDAMALGMRPGATVLRVDSVTYDREDAPVEFSRVLYRMERFRFSLESHRFDDRILHFPTLKNLGGKLIRS